MLYFYVAPRINSKDRADIWQQQHVQKCLGYLDKELRNDQSEDKHRIVEKRFIDKKKAVKRNAQEMKLSDTFGVLLQAHHGEGPAASWWNT